MSEREGWVGGGVMACGKISRVCRGEEDGGGGEGLAYCLRWGKSCLLDFSQENDLT